MYNQQYGYPSYLPGFGNPEITSGTSDIQGVRWVSSLEEVKAASVPFGRSIFMESQENRFHIKDSNGSIRSFTFEEIPQPTPDNFVTRQEFEDLRRKYESVIQQQSAATVQQPAQPDAADAGDAGIQWDPSAGQGAVLPNGGGNGNEQGANQQFA